MNRTKSKGRARLSNSMLNSLMCVCADNSTLESFDPQPAVNHWSRSVHRRPGIRKEKAKSDISVSDSDSSSACELSESDSEASDSELLDCSDDFDF